MPRYSGGQAVVRSLLSEGVRAVFGIPGVHNLDIYDALIDAPEIGHYVARHEQGAAFMADGYARATGKPGVCLPITGPGLTNMATAVAEAYANSSPLVVISSEIESHLIGKQKGALHEMKDQRAFASTITKWSMHLSRVREIPEAIRRAFRAQVGERPRPVHIQIPVDVLGAEDEVEFPEPVPPSLPMPAEEHLARASTVILDARKPVIYAGGGALQSNAGPQLLELSALLGAPILTSIMGKGVVPDSEPLVLGTLAQDERVADALTQADLMIAVGTRFGGAASRHWRLQVPERLIHIDIDRAEISRHFRAEVELVGDAQTTLKAVLELLKRRVGSPRQPWLAVQNLKSELRERLDREGSWEWRCQKAIRQALPADAITVWDMTVLSYAACRQFPVYSPRSFLFPRGFGTLGFALPAALGAKVAHPRRAVLAVCGDGGFMFTCQELATAAHYRLPICVLLVNSNGYHVVKRNQLRRFGRSIDVDLTNPDFGKLADSFGVSYARVKDPEELLPALRSALQSDIPTLVEIPFPDSE